MKLNKEILKYLSLLGNLGFIVMSNILVSIFLYKLYERFFGFNSLIFIIFILFGIISAFYNIYKLIMK